MVAVKVFRTGGSTDRFAAKTDITMVSSFPSGGTDTVSIDVTATKQTIDGFGAAISDTAAINLMSIPTTGSARSNALDDMCLPSAVSSTAGLGLDFFRVNLGACDHTPPSQMSTYDDRTTTDDDTNLSNFSLSRETTYKIPIMAGIKSRQPNVKFLGTFWTYPAWLKTGTHQLQTTGTTSTNLINSDVGLSGSGPYGDGLAGGSLDPTKYAKAAQYVIKTIQGFHDAGVPLWGITVFNEPRLNQAWPSTVMSSTQAIAFLKVLMPAMAAVGGYVAATKILSYDNGYAFYQAPTPQSGSNYPIAVLGDGTVGPGIYGVAWHPYAGDPSAMTTLHNSFPSSPQYLTEGSYGRSATVVKSMSSIMTNFFIEAFRNWSKSAIYWSYATDEKYLPFYYPSADGDGIVRGGATQGVVTIDSTSSAITKNAHYWAFKHVRVVQTGATYVDSTITTGTSTLSNNNVVNNIDCACFIQPTTSNRVMLLQSNDPSASHTVNVTEGTRKFQVTLAALDTMTLTWDSPGTTGGTPTVTVVGPLIAQEGYHAFNITATGVPSTGQTAGAYTWTQTAGPAATLSAATNVLSVTTPPSRTATTMTFRVSFADSGGNSSTASYTVTVLPVTHWHVTATGEIPVQVTHVSNQTLPNAPAVNPTVNADTSVTITWTTPTAGTNPITGYRLERKVNDGVYAVLAYFEDPSVHSFTDSLTRAGTSYTYRMFTTSLTGTSSNSTPQTITIAGTAANPPTYVTFATANGGQTATSKTCTITVPAGVQDGDVGVVFFNNTTTSSIPTAPTGWTLLVAVVNGGECITGYYRVMAATDIGTTVVGTWLNLGYTAGHLSIYRGVDNSAPVAASVSGSGSGTSSGSGSVTTPANGMAVAAFGARTATSGTIAIWTPPSIMTDAGEVDSAATTGTNGSLRISYDVTETAGTYGPLTATCSPGSGVNASILAVLAPAS